jgi:hypothetical protein
VFICVHLWFPFFLFFLHVLRASVVFFRFIFFLVLAFQILL